MSGGVDSSVAAFLLKERGCNVIGVSLKLWDDGAQKKPGRTCCSFEDIHDARRVCDKIEIPFYALDYRKEFREKVIDPFAGGYMAGLTPNPCILCNKHIKFGLLLSEAAKLGADCIATGHYARLFKGEDGNFHLLKAKDRHKDQSYVLYGLAQAQLGKIFFPMGDFTKEEARNIAGKATLPTAQKRESMDICFVPDGDLLGFFARHYPATKNREGFFVDAGGRVLGRHKGIYAYTVGQRRGLGTGFENRMYVKKIDPLKNEIELAGKNEMVFSGLVAGGVNWVNTGPKDCGGYGAKIRYQKDEIPSFVDDVSESAKTVVRFDKPQAVAVAPGQAVVFYRGDEMMGGGLIMEGF